MIRPPFDGLLDIPSGPIRVRITGEGPPLLFCHGVFFPIEVDDESTFGKIFRALEGFTIVRMDARGHGQTPARADGPAHRWDRMAEDVGAIARALGFDRFFLGGISMGAAIALHAALMSPSSIEAMVLFALPTAFDTRPAEQQRYRDLLALGSTEAVTAFVARDLDAIFQGAPLPPAVAAMLEVMGKQPWSALSRVIEGAAESDMPSEASLATLPVPVLLRPWPNDSGHPISTAETLARALPHAQLTVLESFDDEPGIRAAFHALRFP